MGEPSTRGLENGKKQCQEMKKKKKKNKDRKIMGIKIDLFVSGDGIQKCFGPQRSIDKDVFAVGQ